MMSVATSKKCSWFKLNALRKSRCVECGLWLVPRTFYQMVRTNMLMDWKSVHYVDYPAYLKCRQLKSSTVNAVTEVRNGIEMFFSCPQETKEEGILL